MQVLWFSSQWQWFACQVGCHGPGAHANYLHDLSVVWELTYTIADKFTLCVCVERISPHDTPTDPAHPLVPQAWHDKDNTPTLHRNKTPAPCPRSCTEFPSSHAKSISSDSTPPSSGSEAYSWLSSTPAVHHEAHAQRKIWDIVQQIHPEIRKDCMPASNEPGIAKS